MDILKALSALPSSERVKTSMLEFAEWAKIDPEGTGPVRCLISPEVYSTMLERFGRDSPVMDLRPNLFDLPWADAYVSEIRVLELGGIPTAVHPHLGRSKTPDAVFFREDPKSTVPVMFRIDGHDFVRSAESFEVV